MTYDRVVERREATALASTVEIVPCAESDLPQLFVFASAVFASQPGWSDERVLEVLHGDVIFVARERGQLAGSVALNREENETIVIEQLFVTPGHEGHGIGHRLLGYAEGYAIAERARSLRIVVEHDNRPARSFYRRSGFLPVESELELFELVLPHIPN
jgi:ribosomal protein S18 acetylase RimI-like enzyme